MSNYIALTEEKVFENEEKKHTLERQIEEYIIPIIK